MMAGVSCSTPPSLIPSGRSTTPTACARNHFLSLLPTPRPLCKFVCGNVASSGGKKGVADTKKGAKHQPSPRSGVWNHRVALPFASYLRRTTSNLCRRRVGVRRRIAGREGIVDRVVQWILAPGWLQPPPRSGWSGLFIRTPGSPLIGRSSCSFTRSRSCRTASCASRCP